MDDLPTELIGKICCFLNIKNLWALRRVSNRFKGICEHAFGHLLLKMGSEGNALLVIKLFILNGRGGPWFSQLVADSIEDFTTVALYVDTVDIDNQTVRLGSNISIKTKLREYGSKCIVEKSVNDDSCNTARLNRRSALDSTQWCIKGSLSWFSTEQFPIIPKKMFTLESPSEMFLTPHVILDKLLSVSNLKTYDMFLQFSIDEHPPAPQTTTTHINIYQILVSWSVIFQAYCEYNGIDCQIKPTSAHDGSKCKWLLQKCSEVNIDFSPSFWTFDVIM
jgi:hypothetical protein